MYKILFLLLVCIAFVYFAAKLAFVLYHAMAMIGICFLIGLIGYAGLKIRSK